MAEYVFPNLFKLIAVGLTVPISLAIYYLNMQQSNINLSVIKIERYKH